MLQQILSSMHIDPDLLARLPEEDRQKLFHKMRVEQVRRWEAWEEKNLQEEKNRIKPPLPPKPGRKKVHFMVGDDGNPLVWLIDEAKYISLDGHKDSSFSMNNCNFNSIVERFNGLTIKSPSLKRKNSNESQITKGDKEKEGQGSLTKARISTQIDAKDDEEKVEWLKKLQHKLKAKDNAVTSESSVDAMPEVKRVYALLQNTQKNATELQNSIRRSIESESVREIADPETVKQISEIARKAREEIEEINSQSAIVSRNQRNLSPAAGSHGKNRHEKPQSKEAILEWYNGEEKQRDAGINAKTQEQELWFHGMITRQEAESLLSHQAIGTFLVRLSDKLFGYAISYRADDKCKHYLIDASNGHYHLVGESSKNFFKLADMIRYYEVQSITPGGRDFLQKPCPINKLLHKQFS